MTIERFILREEGFKPSPYLCSAGIPTIGYGTTVYPNGTSVKLTDKEITKEYALQIFKFNLIKYEKAVDRYVTSTLTKNQKIALVSLCYNIGITNFRNSTLLKLINKAEHTLASLEFKKWVYADGKISKGLTRRRLRESELYLK